MSPRVACMPRGEAPGPQSVVPRPQPCHRLLGSGAEPQGWSSPCACPTPRVLVRAEPPAPAPQRCPHPQATKRRNERQRQSSGFIGGRAGAGRTRGLGAPGAVRGLSAAEPVPGRRSPRTERRSAASPRGCAEPSGFLFPRWRAAKPRAPRRGGREVRGRGGDGGDRRGWGWGWREWAWDGARKGSRRIRGWGWDVRGVGQDRRGWDGDGIGRGWKQTATEMRIGMGHGWEQGRV